MKWGIHLRRGVIFRLSLSRRRLRWSSKKNSKTPQLLTDVTKLDEKAANAPTYILCQEGIDPGARERLEELCMELKWHGLLLLKKLRLYKTGT